MTKLLAKKPSRWGNNTTMSINIEDRLICALDVDTVDEAKKLVDDLGDSVSIYKIGINLYLLSGLDLVDWLIKRNKKIFLDLKFYDVPKTVADAVSKLANKGIEFLTIHGDKEIIQAAVKARGSSTLKLLAVTVLTSMDDKDLIDLGYDQSVTDLVLQRAKYALDSGCDGVISSAREAQLIKQQFTDSNKLLIVTPGIRPKNSEIDHQKRIATPREAMEAGADYIVVGRPIYGAPDPKAAAEQIIEEMRSASA